MATDKTCANCGAKLGPEGCLPCLLACGLDEAPEKKEPWLPRSVNEIDPLFPNLRLQSLLGRGGMGVVYGARQESLDRDVAVKTLPPEVGNQCGFKARFEREAKALARLSHANIVPIYELGTDGDGNPYYTMKRIEGLTLRQIVAGIKDRNEAMIAACPLSKLIEVYLKVCDAVAYAHSRGVIYRDLKPDNAMVGEFGEVVVMDWGLAKLMDEKTATVDAARGVADDAAVLSTREGYIAGTPSYMAPEQATGAIDELGPHSDVYSLGGILYTLLALRTPVEESSVQRVLLRVAKGELDALEAELPTPDRPHLPAGKIPMGPAAVAMRALATRPQDRYASVLKLQQDLRAWLNGFATSAEDAGLVRQLALLVTRHKAAFTVAVGALLVLTAVAAVAVDEIINERDSAQAARLIAETERSKTAAALEVVDAAKKQAERAAASAQHAEQLAQGARSRADEERERAERASYASSLQLAKVKIEQGLLAPADELLRSLPETYRHWEWHRVKKQLDQSAKTFEGPGAASVSYSPDGRYLATAQRDVRIWDAKRGTLIRQLPGDGRFHTRVSFTPDSRRITVNSATGVRIFDVASGSVGKTLPDCHTRVTFCRLSPNGKLLVTAGIDYAKGDKQKRIFPVKIWELASGKLLRSLTGHRDMINHVAFSPDGTGLLTASNDRSARIWAVESGKLLKSLTGTKSYLKAANFSPDGKLVVGGGDSGLVRIWDAETGELIRAFTAHKDYVAYAAFSPDGEQIVTGSNDGTVALWDHRGELHQRLQGHVAYVSQAAFSPDGNHLVTGGPFGAKLWNVSDEDAECIMEDLGLTFKRGAFSSSGRYLVALASDRTARVWDLHADKEYRSVSAASTGDTHAVFESAQFSPDESQLLTAGRGQAVHLWDLKTGKLLRTFTTGAPLTMRAAFSPDGGQVAAVGRNGVVHVWNLKTKEKKQWNAGHDYPVSHLEFTPESQRLLTSSGDKTARLWYVSDA